LSRADLSARQIWIAGGIGITPFLAWLESLQNKRAATVSAELHYFVQDSASDPFVNRLQALCAALPDVRMHLHDGQSAPASVENLAASSGAPKRTEVWFCGPLGLGRVLRDGLSQALDGRLRFHQEAFEFR